MVKVNPHPCRLRGTCGRLGALVLVVGLLGCATPYVVAPGDGRCGHGGGGVTGLCGGEQCSLCYDGGCMSPPDAWRAGYHTTVWSPLDLGPGDSDMGPVLAEPLPLEEVPEEEIPAPAPTEAEPQPGDSDASQLPPETLRDAQSLGRVKQDSTAALSVLRSAYDPFADDWQPRAVRSVGPPTTAKTTGWAPVR